ncbi:F0F1 ATP synthase subunit delta [Jeotgalibaca porci]|uniref:F0F1 ATP synthase subunit delta n=1 Tax=Jeotgalibaca porci TaxID=1868793 RepID=UPI0035A11716
MDKKEEMIIGNYIDEYLEGTRPALVTLSSAVPLTPEQKERILTAFIKKTNVTKSYEVVEIVDETLIGGVCLESDNFFFDNTIRNNLTHLKQYILEGQ